MRRAGRAGLVLVCAAMAASWAMTTTSRAAGVPPLFDAGRILAGQGGGEPSIAVDLSNTASRNSVYVEAIGGWGSSPPSGDPAGGGPAVWSSSDRGATFSAPVAFDQGVQDSQTLGGDGDVVV